MPYLTSLQYLNLAGITSLRSSDLEGLAHPDGVDEGPPRLMQLNLNNTAVDDTAAPYISACIHLQTLELAGTKFSSRSLFIALERHLKCTIVFRCWAVPYHRCL